MKSILAIFLLFSIPVFVQAQEADSTKAEKESLTQDSVESKAKKELSFYQGVIFMEKLMYESAIRSFDEYMALDTVTPKAYLLRGISRFKLGQFLMAKKDFQKSANLEPENSDHFMWWGKSAEGLMEWEEAKVQYAKVNELKPGWVEAELRYGHCALESGDTAAAKKEFSALQAKGIRSSLLEYDLGRIAFAEGDTAAALSWFKASLQVDQGRSPALVPLAQLSWNKQDTSQALEYLNLYIMNHGIAFLPGTHAKVNRKW